MPQQREPFVGSCLFPTYRIQAHAKASPVHSFPKFNCLEWEMGKDSAQGIEKVSMALRLLLPVPLKKDP